MGKFPRCGIVTVQPSEDIFENDTDFIIYSQMLILIYFQVLKCDNFNIFSRSRHEFPVVCVCVWTLKVSVDYHHFEDLFSGAPAVLVFWFLGWRREGVEGCFAASELKLPSLPSLPSSRTSPESYEGREREDGTSVCLEGINKRGEEEENKEGDRKRQRTSSPGISIQRRRREIKQGKNEGLKNK